MKPACITLIDPFIAFLSYVLIVYLSVAKYAHPTAG